MAMTLAQSAVLAPTQLTRGVIETFVQLNPILDRLPMHGIQGNAYKYDTEGTLPGVAFRAVNAAYTESTGTFNQATESLVIMGGDADVDRFLQQTSGPLADLRAEQTKLKVKAASYFFSDKFFNGDTAVDTNGFDGLKKRLTGAQVIAAATNGLGPLGDGSVNAANLFFDQLDQLVAAVPGLDGSNGAIYSNNSILAKIRGAGRRAGGFDMVQSDITGKREVTWNGIPMLDPGANAAGTLILPQTETQGTAAGITSSIYAVRFGSGPSDGGVTGLQNGSIMVDDLGLLQSQPVWRTRIEWYLGLGVFSGKAAARLTGVLNG